MRVKYPTFYYKNCLAGNSYPSGGIGNCCGANFYGEPNSYYYEQKGILVLDPTIPYTPTPRDNVVEVTTSIGPIKLVLITESEYSSWEENDGDYWENDGY
jgi:hypothetical protein